MEQEQPQQQSLYRGEQTELFKAEDLPDGWDLLHIDQRATTGQSTGERIARDRERYQLIVDLLAEGMSYRRVGKLAHVSPTTVQAIAHREAGEQGAIGAAKKVVSNNLRRFAQAASERLVEEADLIPINQLAVPLAIAVDKMQLLDGEATSRHESIHSKQAPSIADFDRFLEELPRVQADELPQPVSGREIKEAKRGADGAGGGPERSEEGRPDAADDDGSIQTGREGA